MPRTAPTAARIATFLGRYSPAIAKDARAALAKLRKRLPHAHERVYDNYNALVFAFSTSGEPSDFLLSLALYPKWITLFFAHGKGLPDPTKRLEGSGVRIRGVRLASPKDLDAPDVVALIDAAVARAGTPFDPKHRRSLVVQSVSPKRRPRR